MQISSIVSRSFPTASDNAVFNKMKQTFADLGKALESGNLSDAKTALAALEENAPAKNEKGNNPMSAKMEALTKALNSGDVEAAKDAYADIKKTMAQKPSGGSQARGAGGPPPGGAPPSGAPKTADSDSSSDTSKVYDKKDANEDGTVSWKEETDYDLQHPDASQTTSATNQVDSDRGLLDAIA
jgi:soluble cytochrome b562